MHREESRVLIVVCLGTFFHIQSIGSISVSLAAIQKDFGTTLAAVQWIGLMGAIMLSGLSLCLGRAGDLIGRKTVFKTGLTLYTVGAGLAAVSGTFPQLLGSRCLMAHQGKLWKSLMRAHLGDYERLDAKLKAKSGNKSRTPESTRLRPVID